MNNFYEKFAASAERFGGHTAVEVQRRDALDSFTYRDIERMAAVAAGELAARGLGARDRCAILGDNDAHWVAAYLGILRLGGVAVPLDTAYKAAQVATLLRDSGARLVFTTPRYLAVVSQGVAASGSACEVILLHGAAEDLPSFDAVLKSGAPPPTLPACPAMPADTAVMLYTSGTTSDPKGVVLTHANLLAEADAVFQVVHVDEGDHILGVLPLFHALAQLANLLLPFAVGASVVFLESVNTSELLRALQERRITVFACVPQFFYLIHQRVLQEVRRAAWWKRLAFGGLLRLNHALRHHAGVNLGPVLFRRVHRVLGPSMRILVTGGSRFDPAVGRGLYALGFNLLQAYGLTETSGAATLVREGDSRVDSVGHPLPGVEVKVLPPEGAAAAEARDGEVAIRGAIVMGGYFNRPDANAACFRDGWFLSGDLGYLDRDGRLYITGRKKEVIVLSSGKNIYPEEVEAHYLESPYIKEICVMGLARPGEPAAERLHAVVVPDMDVMRERKVLNANEWIRFDIEGLSVQLPSHKRVLSYEVWTGDLPRTTTRKLKRFEIERRVVERAAAAEGVTQAPEGRVLSETDLAWSAQPDVARALQVIASTAKNAAAIHPDANIELELGLDSMERVELLTHLEQVFGTEVPDEVAHRIYTVRELVEAVRPQGDARGAAPASGDIWKKLLAEVPEDDPVLKELRRPKPGVALALFVLLRIGYALAWLLLRFRVTGREHLPRQAPFLLSPNHQSYLDAFLLVSALPFRVFRNLFFVGASEYFAGPSMARIARQINLVPVDPDTNLLRAMQAGAYGLRHGKVLILFPEGERSIDGTIKRFKKGAAILSLHLAAPVVPVALDGVHDVWPRGRGFRWRALLPGHERGARLRMRFSPPLPPPEPLPPDVTLTQAEARYSEATRRLREAVAKMWDALHQEISAAPDVEQSF